MARIRSLHPALFTDERYMALSFPARELIKGLWCEADDQGVFEWKPLTLKARIMPADAIDILELLDELVAGRFIAQFDIGERSYGAIRNFRRYQRPKKPNATYPLRHDMRGYVGLSDIPPAPSEQLDLVGNQFPTGGGESPQMEDGGCKREKENPPHPESPKPRASTRKQRASVDALDDDVDFAREFEETIWPLLPRQVDQKRSLRAYCLARRIASFDEILAGVERLARESKGKLRKHVPRPENWFRDRRWRDQPEDSRVPTAEDYGYDRATQPYAYAPESLEHWRDRCALWFDRTQGGPTRRRWIDEAWGPPPGDPHCRAPTEVLAEFGWNGGKLPP